jgi:hypothetical protein
MDWNMIIKVLAWVFLVAAIWGVISLVRYYEKRNQTLADIAERNIKLNMDLSNRVQLLTIASMLLTLKLCARNNNRNDYVQMYHALYFAGVSKDILNSPERLDEFLTDCIENKIIISEGKMPFTFSFQKRMM